MKSFIGNSSSVRGWALLLALLLGAGMMISACGDEEVPAPTTPAPPPAPPPAPEPEPEPEPTPEPPATPTGLHVDETTATSITWHWNAVEGALGYAVQVSMDEMFDDTDQIAITTETHFTATPVPPETSVYLRVRSGTGTPEALAAAVATGSLEGLLLSDWSTHVTGMTTTVPLPPAPANLRVKDRGSDFIEWEWDAVDGVDGYQSQFSTSTDFSDSDTQFHQGMSMTSRKVSNLDAESDGYLRVRTYTGTLADHTVGMWTEGLKGTTDEPPPAAPLDAPTGLDVTDTGDDSITLEWDSVRNADTYEVEQREPGDDWGDASCGGGGNVVDDEECVASGLSEGTDYDFRVRAVPADDDTRYTTSDWSDIEETQTSGTPPPEPTDPTSGGMGALNVRWHNSGTNNSNIVFVWDRQGSAMYEMVEVAIEGTEIQELEIVANVHVENPCRNVNDSDSTETTARYSSATSATSHVVATTVPGTIRGLCVREEGSSDASFAWGISPAEEPNVVAQPTIDKGKTTELEWTDVDVKEAFDYEVRLASDPERPSSANNIDASSLSTSRAVQSACDAGASIDSFTPDIDLDDRTVSAESGRLSPHTGYLLCIRASNTAGTGNWAVPISNDADGGYASGTDAGLAQELFTRPAAPPSITFDGSESTAAAGSNNEQLAPAWEIGTRNVTNVPRNAADFIVTAWAQNEDAPSAAALRLADCGTTPTGYTAIGDTTLTKRDGLSGFEIEVPTANAIERVGFTRKVYLCAQADSNGATADADKGAGPWSISSVFSVTRPSVSLSSSIAVGASSGTATLKITNWNRAWWYSSSPDRDNDPNALQCDSVGAGTDETTFTGTANTSYTVTAWDNNTCDGNRLATRSGVRTAQ